MPFSNEALCPRKFQEASYLKYDMSLNKEGQLLSRGKGGRERMKVKIKSSLERRLHCLDRRPFAAVRPTITFVNAPFSRTGSNLILLPRYYLLANLGWFGKGVQIFSSLYDTAQFSTQPTTW